MRLVEPEVFLLGSTKVEDTTEIPSLHDWLKFIGAPEFLEEANDELPTDSELLIECAARRCYKSFKPGLNPNVEKN
jgi:thymidylate synthase (FAD)